MRTMAAGSAATAANAPNVPQASANARAATHAVVDRRTARETLATGRRPPSRRYCFAAVTSAFASMPSV